MLRLIFLLTAMFLSGCDVLAAVTHLGSTPATINDPVGAERRFTGVAVDFVDECVVDGYCYIVVDTGDGIANVIIHPGSAINSCQNPQLLNGLPQVNTGDTVEVYGLVQENGFVSLCEDPAYTIQPVAP